jgi:hypothetical protein
VISASEDVATAPETIDIIRDMAARGRLWGAERIRGELLKLGIKVSKRTNDHPDSWHRPAAGVPPRSWVRELDDEIIRLSVPPCQPSLPAGC